MKLKHFLLILTFILRSAFMTFAESNQSQMSTLEKIGKDKFRFGDVIIDQRKRVVEFNATSNQRNGLIEYALVCMNPEKPMNLFFEQKFDRKFFMPVYYC